MVSSSSCTSRAQSSTQNVSVVLEEEVVLDNLGDFVNAFIVLFGLVYAFNMEYNKDLKYTWVHSEGVFKPWNWVQQKVQALRSKLLGI